MKNYLLIFLLVLSAEANAQKRYMDMDLKMGIGAPELLYAGLRFNISRAHYEFSFGGWPSSSNQIASSIFYAHHFGKKWKQELTKQPPWFLAWGIGYVTWSQDYFRTHDLTANIRIGRDLNLTESWSFSWSLGTALTLYHDQIETGTGPLPNENIWPVYPCGQFSIAYTFLKDISDKE